MSSEDRYVRTFEDVSKIIYHAKLEENTLSPVTQALYFADEMKEYKLLELSKELLNKLQDGETITFRGQENDKAVLCCDSKTYDVKEAETSNSLLLIPELKFSNNLMTFPAEERILEHKTILGVHHTYYEVKVCKPKMKKIRKILAESSYRGSELESALLETGIKFYSTADLLEQIQASETELLDGLKKIFAFELDGKWRVLESDYHTRVLVYFLNLIETQSWSINDLPQNEVLELLSDFVPPFVIYHLLSVYCRPITSSSDNPKVRLIENRICRTLGEELLKPHTKFELMEFMKVWQESVPPAFTTKLEQLDGLVYTVGQPNRLEIQYCPEHDLPEDVGERIQLLFGLKSKWTLEEIKPFIQVFTTLEMDENAILTKYARVSKLNGVRFYSSRHGK